MAQVIGSTTSTLEQSLREHFDKRFDDDWELAGLSQSFRREGYVNVAQLVPADVKTSLQNEVYRLLEHAKRVDITIKETGDSPRRMSTVGARNIIKHSPLICELYESPSLRDFLSRLAREPVLSCPYEPERFVITKQHEAGDTHGWHWGDFSFAVIWIIEAPAKDAGGMLQCIPHTDWNKADPRVYDYLVNYPIRTYYHASGDIYFLRTDTTLHRTVPLTQESTRIILNTSFGTSADTARVQTHETMDALFD